MGSSCTGGNFPRVKRKHLLTQNEHESQQSSAPNNEENQPLVDNQQRQQENNEPKSFTFAQMAAATNNFDDANILGEGGFGRVYKGNLEENDQIVAIKKMERQGKGEFAVEVGTLSLVDHPNMVKLIGYCSEERGRLLVYEYMPLGSLSDQLHGLRANSIRLDWNARMKIAAGTAGGLAYLHHQMDPPMIYRDLKASNILLGRGFM